MKRLTASGFWPLYRFDPRRPANGKAALVLDSRPPSGDLAQTLLAEQRFRRLNSQDPQAAQALYQEAAENLRQRFAFLSRLAGQNDDNSVA